MIQKLFARQTRVCLYFDEETSEIKSKLEIPSAVFHAINAITATLRTIFSRRHNLCSNTSHRSSILTAQAFMF